MWLPLLTLLLGTAGAAPDWFHPNGPGTRAELGPGDVWGGMRVDRQRPVLAFADDPEALAARSDVAKVVPLRGDGRVVRVFPAPGVDPVALSRDLHQAPGLRWAHPDFVVRLTPHTLPDDPYLVDQWHLENAGQTGGNPGSDIDAETAWAFATGAGGMVAVLDTGVDTTHPDLRVIPGFDYLDQDEDSNPVAGTDGHGHGTAAAGLAAALGNNGLGVAGVALDAEVYGIRIIGGDSSSGDIYDSFIEAVDAGAWVLSNSWGVSDGCASFDTPGYMERAYDYAEEEGRDGLGAVIVMSAGNGNCDCSGDGLLSDPRVIGIGAANSKDQREWYSNYGTGVDISAPSGRMLTTDVQGEDAGYCAYEGDPDYCHTFSGTSAAAPVVSGVVLLMLEANPRLTAAQVREVLCETAVPIDVRHTYEDSGIPYDETGWDSFYGCGRVDAGAAVSAVANGPPGAAVPLNTRATSPESPVLLAWAEAPDPDADRLSYGIRWWVVDAEGVAGGTTELETTGLRLDLTGAAVAGETVHWQVWAQDGWGPGPESVVAQVQLTEPAEAPAQRTEFGPGEAGCAVAMAPAALGWLGGLAVAARRRR